MKKHARVSEILSLINDFSHIDPEVLKAKATLGTNVHTAIHQCVQGGAISVTNKEIGYVESFKQWRQITNPTFDILEQRYWDDEKMITGQIDALIKLQGSEKRVLVDWKTSASPNHSVWPIQGHLYRYLLLKNNIDNLADHFLFVQLSKYGSFPAVHKYKYSDMFHNRGMQLIDEYWKCMENKKSDCIKSEDIIQSG